MIFAIIGALLLVLAVVMYFVRRHSAALQSASVNWPTADGVVTDARVHSFHDNDKKLNYMARVWFNYKVDGVEYKSERIAWGGQPYDRTSIQATATISKYPVGSRVPVYYNPRKPKQAVLQPAEKGGLTTQTWIAATFAILGILFILGSFFISA